MRKLRILFLCSGVADYRKLAVWQKSHELALNSHRIAQRIRGAVNAPLRMQIIRAAMSVPANIVEGRSQTSERDFVRFLRYAAASAAELDYHLKIASDLGLLSEDDFAALTETLNDVRKMLHGLVLRLRRSITDSANSS